MSLKKEVSYDHFITESSHIQVRTITRVFEDSKKLCVSYHRHVIAPGDDYSHEDKRTILIANAIYTTEFIEKYKARIKNTLALNNVFT